MGTFIKDFLAATEKVTDILNVGRLLFYTAAGLMPMVALAMVIRTAGSTEDLAYWGHFKADLVSTSQNYYVWFAALVAGFLVANLGYGVSIRWVQVLDPLGGVDKGNFSYLYPMLRTGRTTRSTSKEDDYDYAAWLIAEYYRYFEIAMYVPYGFLLSLPILCAHALARLLLDSHDPARLDGAFVGFAVFYLVTIVTWALWWHGYWLPRVAVPIFTDFLAGSRDLAQGVRDHNPPAGAQAAPASEETEEEGADSDEDGAAAAKAKKKPTEEDEE